MTPCSVACQAPLSTRFSRQKYWSGLPFPFPGDLPDPGIEPASPASPALAGEFFTTKPPGKRILYIVMYIYQYQSPNSSHPPPSVGNKGILRGSGLSFWTTIYGIFVPQSGIEHRHQILTTGPQGIPIKGFLILSKQKGNGILPDTLFYSFFFI